MSGSLSQSSKAKKGSEVKKGNVSTNSTNHGNTAGSNLNCSNKSKSNTNSKKTSVKREKKKVATETEEEKLKRLNIIPISEYRDDLTRQWRFKRQSIEELQQIALPEILKDRRDDTQAVFVFAGHDAVKKCILSPVAVVWDHILRSFLLTERKSDHAKKLMAMKDKDLEWAERVKEFNQRRKAVKQRQRELLRAKLQAMGKNLKKLKLVGDSSSSSEDEQLSRANMRYLARSIPVKYYCDPDLGEKFADMCESAFDSEGMNFQNTLSPKNAYIQFLSSDKVISKKGSSSSSNTSDNDDYSDIEVDSDDEDSEEDDKMKGITITGNSEPEGSLDSNVIMSTPDDHANLSQDESVEHAQSDQDMINNKSKKKLLLNANGKRTVKRHRVYKNQLLMFVCDDNLSATKGEFFQIYGNRLIARGEQGWPDKPPTDYVGLPKFSLAICYPDGIIECGFHKLLAVQNGRKNEQLSHISKLTNGFSRGSGPITEAARFISNVNACQRMAFTGAGISAESGVPTYRDPGGLWSIYNPEEVSSITGFGLDPRKVWAFEAEFFKLLRKVKYNNGHKSLAELQFRIVTQNVDGLHQQAGSDQVVEVHGSEVRAICLGCKKTTKMEYVVDEILKAETDSTRLVLKNNMEQFLEQDKSQDQNQSDSEQKQSVPVDEIAPGAKVSLLSAENLASLDDQSKGNRKKKNSVESDIQMNDANKKPDKSQKSNNDKKSNTSKSDKASSKSSNSSSVLSGMFGKIKRKKQRKPADRKKSGDYFRMHPNPELSELTKKALVTYVMRCKRKRKSKKPKKGVKKKGSNDANGNKAEAVSESSSSSSDASFHTELKRLQLVTGKKKDKDKTSEAKTVAKAGSEDSKQDSNKSNSSSKSSESSSSTSSSSSASSTSTTSTTLSQFKIQNGPRVAEVPLCPHCTGQDGSIYIEAVKKFQYKSLSSESNYNSKGPSPMSASSSGASIPGGNASPNSSTTVSKESKISGNAKKSSSSTVIASLSTQKQQQSNNLPLGKLAQMSETVTVADVNHNDPKPELLPSSDAAVANKDSENKTHVTKPPQIGVLKPDGIYFGESLDRKVLRDAIKIAATSKLVLMVGTTGKVDPARQMPLLAKSRNKTCKVIEINPAKTLLSNSAHLCIRESSAKVLPLIHQELHKILNEMDEKGLKNVCLLESESSNQTTVKDI